MRRTTVLVALAAADSELGQALALLEAAGVDEPERLTLGTGDRRLLALHRQVAGRDLVLTIDCPTCKTRNEVVLAVETVPPERPRFACAGAGGGVRQPTYGDLLALPEDPEAAKREVVRRCTVGSPSTKADDTLLELVDDSLAGPLVAGCAGCGRKLEAAIDIEQALLESLQEVVEAVELQVHLIARAYHWEPATIEQLPDERRDRLAAFIEAGR